MNILNLINNLKPQITNLCNQQSSGIIDDRIDLKTIERRKELIDELTAIGAALSAVNSLLADRLTQIKKIQEKELNHVNDFMGKIKSEDGWTRVTRGNKSAPPKHVVCEVPRTTHVTRVKFTEALSVPAIRVQSFDQVEPGELYYVESARHFAFKLGGLLLHGNIGVIYTEEKNPEKIKNCKFAAECIKKDKCDYYHDPAKFPGSHDRRNFIASSWLYAPPNSQFKNKLRSRRFGSLDYLDTDIVELQDEEVARFHDQAMHDLLCSIVLMHYHSKSMEGL